MSASIGGKTSISGDSVDISHDNQYVVTGGGTLGEGVKLWDFRNFDEPVKQFDWAVHENGDVLNPCINAVRFVP